MIDGIYTLASSHQTGGIGNVSCHTFDIHRAEEVGIAAGPNEGADPMTGQGKLFRQVGTEQTGRPRYHVTCRHARIL